MRLLALESMRIESPFFEIDKASEYVSNTELLLASRALTRHSSWECPWNGDQWLYRINWLW